MLPRKAPKEWPPEPLSVDAPLALVKMLGREALGDLRGIQTQDLTNEHNRCLARRRAENAEGCLRRILAAFPLHMEPKP